MVVVEKKQSELLIALGTMNGIKLIRVMREQGDSLKIVFLKDSKVELKGEIVRKILRYNQNTLLACTNSQPILYWINFKELSKIER